MLGHIEHQKPVTKYHFIKASDVIMKKNILLGS